KGATAVDGAPVPPATPATSGEAPALAAPPAGQAATPVAAAAVTAPTLEGREPGRRGTSGGVVPAGARLGRPPGATRGGGGGGESERLAAGGPPVPPVEAPKARAAAPAPGEQAVAGATPTVSPASSDDSEAPGDPAARVVAPARAARAAAMTPANAGGET